MIHRMFTTFDSKAEAYLPPFFAASKGLALRSFTDAANKANHPFCLYPSDFTLFEIGFFDDATAKVTLHTSPISLGVALEFVKRPDYPGQRFPDYPDKLLLNDKDM